MRLLLSSILCISTLSWPLAQCSEAVIHLQNGNRLSGDIASIAANGNVQILSEVSTNSLEIVASAILDIDFSDKLTATTKHTSEQVHFRNGDSLPCSLLSLDKSSASIETWYANRFKIPTSALSNIQFHTKPDSLVYSGPNADDAWLTNSHWTFTAESLRCIGKGEVSRELELPQNFIFKSTVTWSSERPTFKVYFCSDSSETANMKESYFLDFSPSGIHVIRSSKSQPRAQIGEIPLRLRELSTNSLDIEISVDRRTQTISVSLNGENYGLFDDTTFRAPTGKWINFESNLQQNNDSLTLSNISLSQWKGSTLSSGDELAELDPGRDTLFDTEGLRYTGELQQLSRESSTLEFKVRHSNKPLLVPTSQIQSLYFSNTETATIKETPEKYVLRLQGGGSLTVSSILLTNTEISANHSILGKVILQLHSLHKITTISNTDE